jgi:hypothetical protein
MSNFPFAEKLIRFLCRHNGALQHSLAGWYLVHRKCVPDIPTVVGLITHLRRHQCYCLRPRATIRTRNHGKYVGLDQLSCVSVYRAGSHDLSSN